MVRSSLSTKLILRFSLVIVIGVFFSVLIGIRMIGDTIVKRAQDKVRLDLNSAREVYQNEAEYIKNLVRLTARRFFIKKAIKDNDKNSVYRELHEIMMQESLDLFTLTDRNGYVFIRAHNSGIYGDKLDDDIINRVLTEEKIFASTQIISAKVLSTESKKIAMRARIEITPTPKARPLTQDIETSGMLITAAAPIFDGENSLIGVLYAGKSLNRNYNIVDKVKDIVYKGEQYRGKDIGTATIFQGDLRISTNVVKDDGSRAIGTRVSAEVYNQVIEKGIPWFGRAFVVNGWYITAYEPIKDSKGKIIGMLYVGILEAPYADLRNRVVFTFLIIAFLTVTILSIIAYFSTMNITNPLKKLLQATDKIANGDLSQRVNIKAQDEIGQLANSFNHMATELQKATDDYRSLTETLEEKVKQKTDELQKSQHQLIQSEKLSSLGKLSAGIAHEINNPLTSILLNSHLILEKLKNGDVLHEHIKMIIDETSRCSLIVKGLLEFSRQSLPEKKPAEINKVIEETLLLFESQILIYHVEIKKDLGTDLPTIMIDINKIKQVFTNVILNALEAMPNGGILSISSQVSADGESLDIAFQDTGCGISKENLGKIFDPFFTTKGTQGTGLGLSVSYGIINQHNGKINVESNIGAGTVITISLPLNNSTANLKQGVKK